MQIRFGRDWGFDKERPDPHKYVTRPRPSLRRVGMRIPFAAMLRSGLEDRCLSDAAIPENYFRPTNLLGHVGSPTHEVQGHFREKWSERVVGDGDLQSEAAGRRFKKTAIWIS
ncbi:hypothetical protein Pdw03_6607 [Penicillium digitatum]|uniref:Uncharacterized protein n=1 Tax=Penicillium digitatum TaxID=36651 RepID=A0A7T7BK34_PENDI|nr:hypothetical protein Pdw03_6607 [Penicillium digitatum]